MRNDAARIVADEITRRAFEGLVKNIAWVVMPDHLHWLFELQRSSLSAVMQGLKSASARRIGAHCGLAGPLWQYGYYDHRLRADEDLRTQALYIRDHPVRAKLVEPGGSFEHAWCRYPE